MNNTFSQVSVPGSSGPVQWPMSRIVSSPFLTEGCITVRLVHKRELALSVQVPMVLG